MNDNAQRQALISKADSAAYRALKENHLTEFNAAKSKAAAELGVEWKPRRSAAEKARDEVSRILREYPDVRADLVDEIRRQVEEGQGE